MNVPAASPFHLLRAWMRLHYGKRLSRIAIWPVLNPGEDGAQYGLDGINTILNRKSSLAVAEELATRKPALVFFAGPSPTQWSDIFDMVEILRRKGVCSVLATAPYVFNSISAPQIAYHFSRIYCLVSHESSDEDLLRIRLLTSLHPRGPVEARVFGDLSGETEQALLAAGACRVLSWPPSKTQECLVVDGEEIKVSSSSWCADHVWLPK